MILPAHHLRRHVSRRARGLRGVVRAPIPRNAEVSQPQVTVPLKYHVLRLDISVDDAGTMHSIQGLDQAAHEKFGLFLREATLTRNVIAQVTSQ